jgi:hypothetical protein
LRVGLLALALVALLTGCSGDSSSGKESQPPATVDSRSGRSPTELALAHIHADQTQAARVSTDAKSSPEGGGPTTVTVLQEGLADDSVAAVRTVLRYEPDGDGWRLVSSTRTQRCRPGRGHQSFTAADCA